jgi:hypothetical protein
MSSPVERAIDAQVSCLCCGKPGMPCPCWTTNKRCEGTSRYWHGCEKHCTCREAKQKRGETPARARALEILRAHPEGMVANEFGRLMWPDSKGWQTRSRRSSTPAGGSIGAGMQMTSGAFLWRMWRDGLVRQESSRHHQGTWFAR